MQNPNYNNFRDTNECTSRGSCSLSPSIASLETLAIYFSQKLAAYMLKLEKLGAENIRIKKEMVNVWASFVGINEFSEGQLYEIILNEFYMLSEAEKIYNTVSDEKSVAYNSFEFSSAVSLAKTISIGEKLLNENLVKMPYMVRNLSEILFIVIKSVSLNFNMLIEFGQFQDDIFYKIAEALNIFNSDEISSDDLCNHINTLAEADKRAHIIIGNLLKENFGDFSKVIVSHSTRKNKAILVSGNNFFSLLKILQLSKYKNIDVYTHSNLLITHALGKFSQFENLKGHYGDSTENCILDFATFPGAILLTSNSHANQEYLYRGRLFSGDYIVPKGVEKILPEDYSKIIDSAISAKGFSKSGTKPDSTVGFDINEVKQKFSEIISKLKTGEFSRLFIIGTDSHSNRQKADFENWFQTLQNDEAVISFSYESDNDNVYTINIGNYFPLLTYILQDFFADYPISSENIVFFYTTCDVMSLTSAVLIKKMGAKNVYMTDCSPTTVNPRVMKTLSDIYNINISLDILTKMDFLRKNT